MQAKLAADAIPISKKRKTWIRTIQKYKVMYALLLPALIYFAVFKYIPMAGIMIAFKNYNLALELWDSPWVGFKNGSLFMESW